MEQKHQILIVDDAELNRSMLADMLADEYGVIEAVNGVEALAILETRHDEISLVLLDVMMPEMNGFEVLSVLGESEPLRGIPVVMISAETGASYIDRAFDLGAIDYISRPFDEKIVQRRVKNTIMLYQKQRMLEDMVSAQIAQTERESFFMVELLSTIVEFRNGESGLHVPRIRALTALLLRRLQRDTGRYALTDRQVACIVNASALHDIGKIAVPEYILGKSGALKPEEAETLQTHCAVGARILEDAPRYRDEEFLRTAREICRWHHERYDGRGYPDGLRGEAIPLAAQVVGLADAYEALTSGRGHRPALSHAAALRELRKGARGAFQPLLLRCLADVGPQLAEQLRTDAAGQAAGMERIGLSTRPGRGKASDRTLALLEQERTKYRFFASMSREILCEYTVESDLLTLSDWGAAQLGLSEIIAHPGQSAALQAVLRREDLLDLYHRLQEAVPAEPLVHAAYPLCIRGEARWHKVVARPLWLGEEHTELAGMIGKLSDVHEERLQLEALKQRAEQDSLTKLRNHMSVREAIEQILARGDAKKHALVLFDLDWFKSANDRYGHMFGDAVLKHVAQRIVENIRREDVAARIGGDEFLIFAACPDEEEQLAARLFGAVRGTYEGFSISLSMGVALCPQDGMRYEELFHKADQALYAAKKRGRSRFCFYDASVTGTLSVLSPAESEL